MTRCIAVIMLAIVVSISLIVGVVSAQEQQVCSREKGIQDGKAHALEDINRVGLFLGGAVWGWFGMAFVAIENVDQLSIPEERLLALRGKCEEYIAGYLKGYRHTKHEQRLMWVVLGSVVWSAWVLLVT